VTDTMQPTFITLDSAGRIGAVFTGKIVATGLDLTAALGNVSEVNEIRWLRASDSAVVSTLSGNVLATQGGAGADYSGFMNVIATAVGAATSADVALSALSDHDAGIGTALSLVSAPGNPLGQRHNAIVSEDADSGLGVFSNVLLDGGGNLSGMRCISDTTLATNPAQVDIALPTDTGGPPHAMIVCTLETTSGLDQNLFARFNGDTGNNYRYQDCYGQGTSAFGRWDGGAAVNVMLAGDVINATDGNNHNSVVLIFPDFSSTTRYKTMIALHGMISANVIVGIAAGMWKNAGTKVSQVNLFMGGANFAIPCRFTTYVFGSRVS
jgi:hypothetical protein